MAADSFSTPEHDSEQLLLARDSAAEPEMLTDVARDSEPRPARAETASAHAQRGDRDDGVAEVVVAAAGDPDSAVAATGEDARDGDDMPSESISSPAKVLRIGSMIRQLLEEVRRAPLDEAGRERLAEIYETSVSELSTSLSPDLRSELARVSLPFGEGTPSEGELRLAQAQLVGWLEGLFHGIQAAMFSQQAAQQVVQQQRGGPAALGRGTQAESGPPPGGVYL